VNYRTSELLPEHAAGLICLSGCPTANYHSWSQADISRKPKNLIRRYMEMVRQRKLYLELQRNLVFGESERNKKLMELAAECGVKIAATGNVHYHVRERHQLQELPGRHPKLQEPGGNPPRTPPEFRVLPPAGAGAEALFRAYLRLSPIH